MRAHDPPAAAPPALPAAGFERRLDLLARRLDKLADAALLLECLRRHRALFDGARRVLELGAGLGWGACLVKALHPATQVLASDSLESVLAIVPRFEHLFEVRLDGRLAGASHALPCADACLDLAFCFAAAHQFERLDATLAELARVLRPGGHALLLFEPTSPAWLLPLARRRRARRGPTSRVLAPRRVLGAARACGLEARLERRPSLARRGPAETVYYGALRALPVLQRVLPCTADFLLRRPT